MCAGQDNIYHVEVHCLQHTVRGGDKESPGPLLCPLPPAPQLARKHACMHARLVTVAEAAFIHLLTRIPKEGCAMTTYCRRSFHHDHHRSGGHSTIARLTPGTMLGSLQGAAQSTVGAMLLQMETHGMGIRVEILFFLTLQKKRLCKGCAFEC